MIVWEGLFLIYPYLKSMLSRYKNEGRNSTKQRSGGKHGNDNAVAAHAKAPRQENLDVIDKEHKGQHGWSRACQVTGRK